MWHHDAIHFGIYCNVVLDVWYVELLCHKIYGGVRKHITLASQMCSCVRTLYARVACSLSISIAETLL